MIELKEFPPAMLTIVDTWHSKKKQVPKVAEETNGKHRKKLEVFDDDDDDDDDDAAAAADDDDDDDDAKK